MSARPVWGFAEIHSHLFAHLGFEGFLWGEPDSTSGGPATALRSCDGMAHERTNVGSITLMAAIDGLNHGTRGFPSLIDWPKVEGLGHQQMFIDWITRAFQGGLRLMVAHAVDSAPFRAMRRWNPDPFGSSALILAQAPGLLVDLVSVEPVSRLINWLTRAATHEVVRPLSQRNVVLSPEERTNDWRFSSIRLQIQSIRDFVTRHSNIMAIAESPQQARQIILGTDPLFPTPRLAVVLGIETDNLVFPDASLDYFQHVLLPSIFLLGVRHIFPIHLTDNWFGGCSVYQGPGETDLLNSQNEYVSGHFHEIADLDNPPPELAEIVTPLSGADVQFRFLRRQIRMTLPSLLTLSPDVSGEGYFENLHQMELAGDVVNVNEYQTNYGHVNNRGLTQNGIAAIKCLMARGMIIDIDHMSQRSAANTIQIANGISITGHTSGTESGYPLVSGHSSFREIKLRRPPAELNNEEAQNALRSRWPSEGDLSPGTVQSIRDLGGMVAPVTNPSIVGAFGSQVQPDSPSAEHGTARSFAQNYLYAINKMGNRGVAIGTDFNGFNGKPISRPELTPEISYSWTGQQVTGGIPPGQPLYQSGANDQSPLDMSITGDHGFNYSFDGLVHYGLLPDFFQELKNIGIQDDQLSVLFRSAEDYIVMWEKCIRMSRDLSLNGFRGP